MPGYYHLSVDVIGRGTGRSAVACAAYRAGQTLHDERYGKTHDYTPRKGIIGTGISAPEEAPAWVNDRAQLWNRVEAREKRKDAQLAREFELSLPHQLSIEQQREILQQFISQELTARGLVADWAIHAPNRAGDQRNYHAHVMATMRPIGPEGFEANKDRSQNTTEQLGKWREAWAEIQNRAFERHRITGDDGRAITVDHRSYEGQGAAIEPTQHLGVHAMAMERRGIKTDAGTRNREIHNANDNRILLRRQARNLDAETLRLQLQGKEQRAQRILNQLDRDRGGNEFES